MKTCKLCEKEKALEVSHILPKFFFRYLKKTSPSGFIRSTENPNRVTQDGLKTPFLCSTCEDLFSIWETKFSNEIFYPYVKDEKVSFEYEEWLSKFLASVSFRVLTHAHSENKLDFIHAKNQKYITKAIDNLRLYLLGKSKHPLEQRQLLLLLERTDFGTTKSENGLFNMYMIRGIEHDIITNDDNSFIFMKYPSFLHLCPIHLQTKKGWHTARINHQKGKLYHKDHELPDYVLEKLTGAVALLQKSHNSISEKQHNIIDERMRSISPEKLLNSPIAKAYLD